jgi:PleD family two-component response regulator
MSASNDSKTVFLIDHDYLTRHTVFDIASETLPGLKLVEYTLARRALDDLDKSPIDLVITSSRLLDYEGSNLTKAVRAKIPRLPIITLLESGDASAAGIDSAIDWSVSKEALAKLLPPALIFLLHKESLTPRIGDLLEVPELPGEAGGAHLWKQNTKSFLDRFKKPVSAGKDH